MYKGNQICYHQTNWLECQRNPDIKPIWKYVIWYPDESEWAWQYCVADFDTEEQLKRFAKTIGFEYEWTEIREDGFKSGRISVIFENHSKDKEPCDEWQKYSDMAFHSENKEEQEIGNNWLERHFENKCQAYSINSEHLMIAKPIKALSNGSIVDCYFINDGERVKFYRCNPNAKNFYHPLPLAEHIKYQQEFGSY